MTLLFAHLNIIQYTLAGADPGIFQRGEGGVPLQNSWQRLLDPGVYIKKVEI